MVYFVGAGPGHKELITVRGMKLLQQADCIIYAGSLVNPELLDYAKSDCVIHDSAGLTLEQVISICQTMTDQGKMTVRLHTGDPSLYGAIREQMDELIALGIEYQVIPGVSSFAGAAAQLGVEYTLPGVSQTVILTRMAGRTPVPEKESIERLAASQSSMAIFLSSGQLPELTERLLAGGYRPETPVAIVYKATWPDELVLRTELAQLAKTGQDHGITKTAIILVGDFLGSAYDRSLLYHPSFSHGYRTGQV